MKQIGRKAVKANKKKLTYSGTKYRRSRSIVSMCERQRAFFILFVGFLFPFVTFSFHFFFHSQKITAHENWKTSNTELDLSLGIQSRHKVCVVSLTGHKNLHYTWNMLKYVGWERVLETTAHTRLTMSVIACDCHVLRFVTFLVCVSKCCFCWFSCCVSGFCFRCRYWIQFHGRLAAFCLHFFFAYLCLSAVPIHMVLWCESFSVWMFVWLACTPFVCYQTDFVVIVRFLCSLDLVICHLCLSLVAPNTSDCVICVIRLLLLSHNVFFFVYRNAYWWCGLCYPTQCS